MKFPIGKKVYDLYINRKPKFVSYLAPNE